MNREFLLRAFKYKRWSDQRHFDAIRLLQDARHSAFTLQQLNHMAIVEELFRARLLAQPAPHAATNTQPLPPLDTLVQRISASNAWLIEFVASIDAVRLDEVISFCFTDGQSGAMSVREILFHLINHGTYHRGAIGHALDLAGVARPADTYTVFIHAEEPERRRPPDLAAGTHDTDRPSD